MVKSFSTHNNDQLWNKILSSIDWNSLYEYLKLKNKESKGDEVKFCCPLHSENTPSFFINKKKGAWNCFGCGQSGNLITLIAKIKYSHSDEPNKLAFQKLLSIAKISEDSLTIDDVKSRIEKLLSIDNLEIEDKKEYIIPELPSRLVSLPEQAVNFLRKRNISMSIANYFGIKFCDYGYFSGRIIIPLYNNGKFLSFEARSIDEKERNDKVWYPKNSPVKKVIFNYDNCKDYEQVNLVEGIMDALSMLSRGFKNTVSCLGTSISGKRDSIKKRKLMKSFDDIIIFFDPDKAGIEAAFKLKNELQELEIKTRIAIPKRKVDPKYLTFEEIKIAIKNSKEFLRNEDNDFDKIVNKLKVMNGDKNG